MSNLSFVLRGCAAFILLSAMVGAHAEVTVSASCRALIFDSVGYPPQQFGDSCSDLVSSPITGTISDSRVTGMLPPTGILLDTASAGYSARGDYGNLGVSANSMAGIPAAEPHHYSALGQASVTVTANDTISVTSALLAAGTNVTIDLSGYFEGTVLGSVYKSFFDPSASASSFVSGYLVIREQYNGTEGGVYGFDSCFGFNGPGQCITTNGGFYQAYSGTMLARVGSTLSLSSYLSAYSDSMADNLLLGYDLYGSSESSAMNSFTTSLTPVTDGVQLLAESGHDYRAVNPISPVPEPETYAMLLVGLGLLGFTAHRRKNFNA